MAPFLKSILGNGAKDERLSAEMRSTLAEMQQERAAFEKLLSQAEGSANKLQGLQKPIADTDATVTTLKGRLGELSKQMQAVQALVPQLASVQEQSENLVKGQRRAEAQLNNASTDAERITAQVDDVSAALDEAMRLKESLADFLELGGPLKDMRGDADDLAARLSGLTDDLNAARNRGDQLTMLQREAATQIESFDQRFEKLTSGVDDSSQRLGELSHSMEDLEQLAAGAGDTKRQLGTLRALTDYVSQKIAALEQQKESVDRATRQAQGLGDLMRKLDVQVQKQQESAGQVNEFYHKVEELQSLHTKVLARSEEITAQQEAVERHDKTARDTMASLQADVQKAVQRFEVEKRGLDGVSQRVVDLRGSLSEIENGMQSLDESRQAVEEVQSKADALSNQVREVGEDIDHLEDQAVKVRAVRSDVDRLEAIVAEASKRGTAIEDAQPAVEAALRDYTELNRSHEAIRDALEQVRVVEGEMTRVRENQGEAQTWLGDVTEAMGALRMRVKEVAGMKPAVDLVRSEVERVTHAMGSVESRREFLDEMNKRLSDLSSTASRLDERTKGLNSRMETADQRFVALSLHAEEAARVEKVVPIVLQGVEDAEERVAEVGETISNLEARAQKTEALAERMRKMGEDLDQRQGALEAATEHLDRVSELRQEAAATAQDLSEETRKLTAALGSAEGRADRLSELSDQLEDRSGNLRFTEKRLAQFEEKLARWELLETQLTRSLDQLNERQGTVDALQADIKHLFAMAERTVEGVRSISEAHQEIVHTRAALDDVLTQMRDVDETIDDLELRKRQIERAEERLARADALVIDIQSSLETLHGQKAFLDHVIEKAGSLTFQAKQAEALIDTLREERELTNRVRSAVADMRDQNLKAG